MGVWTVTLIGLVIILAAAGLSLVYFLRQALDSSEATKVDKLPPAAKPKS